MKLCKYSLQQIFFEYSSSKNIEVVKLTSPSQKEDANELESTILFKNSVNPKQRYYGIYKGEKLVAMTRVNINPLDVWKGDENYPLLRKLNPEIAISATAVDPEFRHKGYATVLKQYLQKHYSSILTGTGSKSHPSMTHINQQLGFVPVLKQRGNIQYFWENR